MKTGQAQSMMPWILAPLIIVLLLATCLVGKHRLAFRDVSHFYTPLYDYIGQRNDATVVPMWNPLDQAGMPLLGETTTAVLYPPRYLVYRIFDGHQAMSWYVAIHLMLASVLMVISTRRIGIGWLGQTIAACTYVFSGGVFFLYTNPPFLVSAAWLPLAMTMLIDRGGLSIARRVLTAGPAVAMMILGGDPQTSLHAVMVAGVVVMGRLIASRLKSLVWREDFFVMCGTGLLALLLALPQVVASIDWSRQSDRIGGVGQAEAMRFSVPPWHFVELIVVNAAGNLLPANARISNLIPGDGQMWTPTLFMGLLSAWMILRRLQVWRPMEHDRYLVIALLSALFAMGDFGLYPLLYDYFPGYDAFRYPAKWLPFFSFGLAVATAVWLDAFEFQAAKASGIAILLITMIGFCLACFPWGEMTDRVDKFWGPLSSSMGLRQVRLSFLCSFVVMILIMVLIRRAAVGKTSWVFSLLLILSGHWYFSSRWMLWTVDTVSEDAQVRLLSIDPPNRNSRWIRMMGGDAWPSRWRQEHDESRLEDVEMSQRMARFGRWHLTDHVAVFNNFVSIRSNEQARFWRAIRELESGGEPLDWVAIGQWLGMTGKMHQASIVTTQSGKMLANVRWDADGDPGSMTTLESDWRVAGLHGRSDAGMSRRLMEILSDVEVGSGPILFGDAPRPSGGIDQQKRVLIREESIDLGVMEVSGSQCVAVVRTVFQDGNWCAAYQPRVPIDEADAPLTWQTVEVHSADFLKQAIVLPPGDWVVKFWYQPNWWWPAVAASMLCWLSVLFFQWSIARSGF